MSQQIIALVVILFFVSRLFVLKKKGALSAGEFIFWLAFWFLSGVSILFLKKIDRLVADFGFSSSGINFLAYLAILILFYLIFRLRLKIEKMNKDITAISRKIALDNREISDRE